MFQNRTTQAPCRITKNQLKSSSGSGKSMIATAIERELLLRHETANYVLDGDDMRRGLYFGLGFAPVDRRENIRRTGKVCKLFADSGTIILAAFVSPYGKNRDKVRSLLGTTRRQNNFVKVHVRASVSTCKERHPKGLCKLERSGKIPNCTGLLVEHYLVGPYLASTVGVDPS